VAPRKNAIAPMGFDKSVSCVSGNLIHHVNKKTDEIFFINKVGVIGLCAIYHQSLFSSRVN
jgi:hypothetical protein